MSTKDSFYLDQEEPIKSCVLAMRDLVLNHDPDITETVKYGMPCFCYSGKAFCYLWVDKKTKEPYYLFVEGKHLDHPHLESGNRARMKILRVNAVKDLPLQSIKEVLNQALDLYKK
jgi:hypothetical protein